MRQTFFNKNHAITEILSFADICAILFLEERNDHSLPALL